MDATLNETVELGNSTQLPPEPHLVAYKVLLLVLVAIPITIIDGAIIIILAIEQGLNPRIRVALASIPFASILVAFGHIVGSITALSLVARNASGAASDLPSTYLCAFIYFVVTIGSSGRHLFMAVFSATVFIIVRYGMNRVKVRYFGIVTALLWIGTTIFQAALFVPHIIRYEFFDSAVCKPVTTGLPSLIYIVLYFITFCVVPYAITITMATLTCCYTKKNTFTTNLPIGRAMVKFTLFLTMGNAVSIVGVTAPGIVIFSRPENTQLRSNLIMTSSILVHLSLVPLPFLLIAYFAPLRAKILQILRRCFTAPFWGVYTKVFTSISNSNSPTAPTSEHCHSYREA